MYISETLSKADGDYYYHYGIEVVGIVQAISLELVRQYSLSVLPKAAIARIRILITDMCIKPDLL